MIKDPRNILISKLSKKYNLPKEVIKSVVESQYYFTRKIMSESDVNKPETFKTIRIKYFCIFYPKKIKK